jgi:hypothetical protein
MVIAAFFVFATPAQAATRYVSTTGSDTTTCTQTAPCKSLARAYTVSAAGDTVEVAAGSYVSQTVSGGTKAVTFVGGENVIVRNLVVGAANTTFDGINIDAAKAKVLGR